ncbi:hypothetical protein [Streptomyces sp. NPDC020965]|uniref:hypothetical protein n=1 Tax=Streptomyces sp. NPDC020965 TaxID=3365105 RepID=UPI0037AC3F85
MGITGFIAVMASVIFGLVIAVALRALHRAWWLAALSLVPSLMVMFGAGDYTPELALEQRGVREQVTITADSAAGTDNKCHAYTLRGDQGILKEKTVWRGGGSPYEVGDRIEILRDPEGIPPLWDRSDVDSAEKLDWLIWEPLPGRPWRSWPGTAGTSAGRRTSSPSWTGSTSEHRPSEREPSARTQCEGCPRRGCTGGVDTALADAPRPSPRGPFPRELPPRRSSADGGKTPVYLWRRRAASRSVATAIHSAARPPRTGTPTDARKDQIN